MELHLVGAVPVPIVRAQPRRVLVRLRRPRLRGPRPGELPQLEELRPRPGGALAVDRVAQRAIAAKRFTSSGGG